MVTGARREAIQHHLSGHEEEDQAAVEQVEGVQASGSDAEQHTPPWRQKKR
jgi:hypothetical protein